MSRPSELVGVVARELEPGQCVRLPGLSDTEYVTEVIAHNSLCVVATTEREYLCKPWTMIDALAVDP